MLVNLSKRNIELFQDLLEMEIYNCNQDKLPFKRTQGIKPFLSQFFI